MNTSIVFPERLVEGDEVRIIAPSDNLLGIGQETREYACQHFKDIGLHPDYSVHVEGRPGSRTSPIQDRIIDLHDAFADDSVAAVFTATGGLHSNQLLGSIDWNLIKGNPKVFCGFSDATVLLNAVFAKTGLVTYHGPHYSSLGQKLIDPYTLSSLKDALFNRGGYKVMTSDKWSDDVWWNNQNSRELHEGAGNWVIQEGSAEGTIIGGNLTSFLLLQGTQYMPRVDRPILFLEDISRMSGGFFHRNLQAIAYGNQKGIAGLAIGRFSSAATQTEETIGEIVSSIPELAGIPVIANVDFGHTEPRATFPIGGLVTIEATKSGDSTIYIK